MKCVKIAAALLIVSISLCRAQKPKAIKAASDPDKWELEWNDEFSTPGLPDSSKWAYEAGFVRNNESQYYTPKRAANARIENGSLLVESLKEDFPNANYLRGSADWKKKDSMAAYTSACLYTKGKKEFLYGRLEISAQLPQGTGSWPALWLVGTVNLPWPGKGEIDVMEHLGYDTLTVYGTVHAASLDPKAPQHKISKGGTIKATTDILNNYHLYAMEWYEDRIDFFFDNTKYFSYVFKDYNILPGTFNKPFYLLINNAIGGSWGGKKGIDDSSFPQQFFVDYVRYFKRKQ